jgi:hypothetical protein
MKKLSILLLLLVGCGLFEEKSPEQDAVKDTIKLVDEMIVIPTADGSKSNTINPSGVKVIKNTLAFCEKTIAKNEREIAEQEKKIIKLQKEIVELNEQLAKCSEKSGQVDLLNKIIMIGGLIGIGFLLFQFLPVIKRLIGLG